MPNPVQSSPSDAGLPVLNYARPPRRYFRWEPGIFGFALAALAGGCIANPLYYSAFGVHDDSLKILFTLQIFLVIGSLLILFVETASLMLIAHVSLRPSVLIYSAVGLAYGIIPAAGFKISDYFPHKDFSTPAVLLTIIIPLALPLGTFLRYRIAQG